MAKRKSRKRAAKRTKSTRRGKQICYTPKPRGKRRKASPRRQVSFSGMCRIRKGKRTTTYTCANK